MQQIKLRNANWLSHTFPVIETKLVLTTSCDTLGCYKTVCETDSQIEIRDAFF